MGASNREVPYMERTRAWYRALGYTRDYVWAHHESVPFAPLPKPIAECTLALVGTATPTDASGDPILPKRVYSLPVTDPPSVLYTADLAWDKNATHTEDLGTFLPITQLREFATKGRIRALAPRFHGVPTEYSQRRTTDIDAPEILRRCREDAVDIALLVPL
jgi:hypothetical protein